MKNNYRNTDPPTSALAGREADNNGSARQHRAMCFETVMQTPGLTAREIEDRLGIKAHKRLPELRRAGMIRNGKSRTCTVSGKQALPYPPSVNHYYRRVGPRTLISREGREYRRAICGLLAHNGGGPRKPPAGGRIALAMDVFPPDRRRRDLDNLLKSTQDSLAHAGVFKDDSQIDLLAVRRCEPVRGGKVVIQIAELPLHRCPLCGGRYSQTESEHNHDN